MYGHRTRQMLTILQLLQKHAGFVKIGRIGEGLRRGGETVPGDSWATPVETSHLSIFYCVLDGIQMIDR